MKIVQMVRMATAAAAAYVGAVGQLIVDTGSWVIRVQDGSTPGGFPTPTLSGTNTWAGAQDFEANVTGPDSGVWSATGLDEVKEITVVNSMQTPKIFIGPQDTGGIIKIATNGNVASAGTLDLDTESGGGSFSGILCISSTRASNGNIRTSTQYAISGRGTVIDAITALNSGAAGGGQAFSLSYPSAGVIRVTNNDANASIINMLYLGTMA